MRLILIGTDRNIFNPQNAVRERLARFGSQCTDSQDSIVFSTRSHKVGEPQELAPTVHAYPTNSMSRLFYGWDATRIARSLPRPDIISAQDPFETGLAAFFIARHFHVPFAVEIHTDFLSPEFSRHSLLNRLRVLIAGFVLRHASGGYAVSQHLRDAVVKRYSLKTEFGVLPIFVDVTKFRSLPRTPVKGNLLWIGRFTAEKDPLLAIAALAAARRAGHDVRLALLGSGPLEATLKQHAQRLNVLEFLTFPGWNDPAKYLPEAELVLATSRYEGYGMAIVEALAAQVPVLSTDVGIAHEAGAVIVKGSFADALCEWLATPQREGTLKLPLYENEADYFSMIQKLYGSLARAPART